MRKVDVKVGETYYATVSGKRTRVRITSKTTRQNYGYYGINSRLATFWTATNLITNRDVIIKSAARLTAIPEPAATVQIL